jgi:hypothetical protein
MNSDKKPIQVLSLSGPFDIEASSIADIYHQVAQLKDLPLDRFSLSSKGVPLAVVYPLETHLKDVTLDKVGMKLNLETCPLESLNECRRTIINNIALGVRKMMMAGEDASDCQSLIEDSHRRYSDLHSRYFNDEQFVNDCDPIDLTEFGSDPTESGASPTFIYYEGGKKYRIRYDSILDYVDRFYDARSGALLNPYTRQDIDEPFKSDLIHIWRSQPQIMAQRKALNHYSGIRSK